LLKINLLINGYLIHWRSFENHTKKRKFPNSIEKNFSKQQKSGFTNQTLSQLVGISERN